MPVSIEINSQYLKRKVRVDIYAHASSADPKKADLLLINDGQDLASMDFENILSNIGITNRNWVCAGIHAGEDRKQEYGVIGVPDYMGRGSKADMYASFVLIELMYALQKETGYAEFVHKNYCGFSLGGLMAFDMTLEYPDVFDACGVFSGSFWWRSKGLDDGYVEERDRIMHAKLRTKKMTARQRFFLQTGQLDEKADRNKNGIIDSIDDTLGIIIELKKLGYEDKKHIQYLELSDGSHDVKTWARVMPVFLRWLIDQPK